MPPKSRGPPTPAGLKSKSTPNLPTERSIRSHATVLADAERHLPEPAESQTSSSPNPHQILHSSDDSGTDEDEESIENVARPLHASRSQTQLRSQPATGLFPPFYNRPPLPLPPSPSLTSLLRPPFSTTTSRPTTPDSSDIDLPRSTSNGTSTPASSSPLASITKSAQQAPTVPRASPNVPTYEFYGFAMYMASSAAFMMYILWAYLPSPLLHQLGIHYYPNRWWALAVPAWLVMLIVYIYVALASYNTRYLTLPMNSFENLVDECGQIAVVDPRTGEIVRDAEERAERKREKGGGKGGGEFEEYRFDADADVDWKALWSTGTDAVLDIPIGGVCEVLYGDRDGY